MTPDNIATISKSKRPRIGGVVLCGGQSRRMGVAKSDLWFGSETMLQRIVRIVAEVYAPLVVVAAADQVLPEFAADLRVARDRIDDLGPLEGMAVGLTTLPTDIEAAFVTSCDVPLLDTCFLEAMRSGFESKRDEQLAVLVRDPQRLHPLPGVYSRQSLPVIESLLAARNLRVGAVAEQIPVHELPLHEVMLGRDVDPLQNVNVWDDYWAALRAAFGSPG